MAVLTASRVVLERLAQGALSVTFAQEQSAENVETPAPAMRISREMYEDMGSPTHVTVTVEAGDTLNA